MVAITKLSQHPGYRGAFAASLDLLAPFESSPHLAVAVSGGADSMALLLLTHEWAVARGGRITALTVDHGLREESALEAEQVSRWCADLGIAHHTLRWSPPENLSGVQASARDARYRLLTGWCKAHRVLHLLTAHHEGDLVETLFFRLARGSGLSGLACIPSISLRSGVRLLRPLLPFAKSELIAHLQQHAQPWIEDPTNAKDDYTRNRIRRQLEPLGSSFARRAADVAQRLGLIRHALEQHLAASLAACVSIRPEGYALIDKKNYYALPHTEQSRVLLALMQCLAGEQLRSEKIDRLALSLRLPAMPRRSLGGYLFSTSPLKRHILVSREPSAVEPPLELAPMQPRQWDGRFDVSHSFSKPLRVQALGKEGIQALMKASPKLALPEKRLLASLPSMWHLEELVFIPHIEYHHPRMCEAGCKITFKPAKTLGFSAFSGMNRI